MLKVVTVHSSLHYVVKGSTGVRVSPQCQTYWQAAAWLDKLYDLGTR